MEERIRNLTNKEYGMEETIRNERIRDMF